MNEKYPRGNEKKIEMFCMFSLIKYLFSVSFSNVVCG